jgi:hypothetical protein
VNVEEFYAADPERRSSDEVPLGDGWSSVGDPSSTFTLFWIRDTGELCLMQAPSMSPKSPGSLGPYGSGIASVREPRASDLQVRVIARIASEDRLREVLEGHEEAEQLSDGVEWLKGIATATD